MNESLSNSYTWVLKLFFPFFAILLIVRGIAHFADDPGVGWHLANGRNILSSFVIPRIDTFLSIERPWISDQWGADLIFAFVFHNFNWLGLYVFCFILFFTSFYISTSGKSLKVSSLAFFLSMFCVFQLLSIHALLRPVLWSFIFFVLQYKHLTQLLNERKTQVKTYFFYFISYALWSNLHPSFMLGLVLVFFAVLSETLYRFSKSEQVLEHSMTNVLILLGICGGVGSFCNPNGYYLHASILELGASDFFMTLNREWLPLSIKSLEGSILTVMLFSILFSKLFLQTTPRVQNHSSLPSSIFSFLICFFFLYQSFNSVRFVPYLALLLFIPFAKSLDLTFQWLLSLSPVLERRSSLLHVSLTSFLLVYFLVIALMGFSSKQFNVGPSKDVYPYSMISFLKENAARIERPLVIYNHPDLGGFLTYFGEGIVVPVLDDRNGLLREPPYSEFLSAKSSSSLTQIAKKYQARFVITSSKKTPITDDLSLLLIKSENDFLLYEVR
jgi:hypothetical protein